MKKEKICKILELGFGGVGVAKEEGKVYFVPFAAPGDLVKVTIEKEKSRFAFGKIAHIISPSLLRIKPPCPYYERCGGCQLQHLPRDFQRDFKQKLVKEAFHKYAHLEIDFPLAELQSQDLEYRYRDHITLHYNQEILGFYSSDEEPHLMEIKDCLLFKKEISGLTSLLLREGLKKLKIETAHVKLINTPHGIIVAIRPKRPWKWQESLAPIVLNLQKAASLYAIGIMDGEGSQFETDNFSVEFLMQNTQIQISPWSFLQNQSDLALRAYQTMEEWLREAGSKAILDLFSGSGIQTLSLAPSFTRIIAIENNPFAVQSARFNAEKNQVKNVHFLEGDAEKFDVLMRTSKEMDPKLDPKEIDAVILNPPKGGCSSELLAKISAYKIPNILYMSCYPATLARDCAILQKMGYSIRLGKVFDFFPQTTHVETIVWLSSTIAVSQTI